VTDRGDKGFRALLQRLVERRRFLRNRRGKQLGAFLHHGVEADGALAN